MEDSPFKAANEDSEFPLTPEFRAVKADSEFSLNPVLPVIP